MIEKYLKKYFNHDSFRPGQKEIAEAVLAGSDTVALMPTGGGKSLCYQLPAAAMDGLSVVISPLIALMQDQVDALNAKGIPAAFINSSLSPEQIKEKEAEIKSGKIKLLYAAPERFASERFRHFFSQLSVDLLAVDEAHCVSQWGHDFRPDYLQIKNYIKILKKRPVVAAFTATATPEVKNDIISRLELTDPKVFVRGFDRSNLVFLTRGNIKPKERYEEVLRIVGSLSGSGIVYALTRKDTETIAEFLKENGIEAKAYHAGMEADKRKKVQNDFMSGKARVIVATVAFGMGVDKADIRFVIHAGMPGSLEGYYQEAGRAGRDGKKAFCVLLHSKKDVNTHKFFIRGDRSEMWNQGKDENEIYRIISSKYNRLDRMTEYALGDNCRRRIILSYFGDPDIKNMRDNCGGCDICIGWKGSDDSTSGKKPAQKKRFLSKTIKDSAKLYQEGHTPAQIARKRNLNPGTILGHLAGWHESEGGLRIEDFVSESERQAIEQVAQKTGPERLGPIKGMLPNSIDYGKIKIVVADLRRREQGK